MSIAFLIVLLAVLSGVIAYVGDWLGSYVGKKRLSLFGTRPRRTGKIIGIGAGIAIMFVTLGTLSLVFRQSWNIIFRYQSVLETVTSLQVQEKSLSSKVGILETQLSELKDQNLKFSNENTNLLATNKDLDEANQKLSDEVAKKTADVTSLGERVNELTQLLDEQARKLATITQQLDARGNLTYRDAEMINSTVIEGDNANAIRTELTDFIQATDNITAQRGAGEIILSTDQFSSLVEAAASTPNPDVIVLRSDNNQFGPTPLAVTIESFENEKVFVSGQLLVSLPIVLPNQSQAREIRTEVIKLWQIAREKLINKGVIDSVSPDSFIESSSTEGFLNQLLRLSGQGKVSIGLIVNQDIYISGPAQLELVILN